MTRIQTHQRQACHQRKGNATRRKSVVYTGRMTHQTHCQATIMICPTTVITDASDVGRKATGKRIR